jgi:carboxylesterase type B
LKPVVVYIHGGDFSDGIGCETGIENVSESGDVVAVEI